MVVVGGIKMGAVMGREIHGLHRPSLVRPADPQLSGLQRNRASAAGSSGDRCIRSPVDAWRIGWNVVLQGYGNIDQSSRHGAASDVVVFSFKMRLIRSDRLDAGFSDDVPPFWHFVIDALFHAVGPIGDDLEAVVG